MSSCQTKNLKHKQNKIRKRGCSSITSSSTFSRRYRFKKAILIGKKSGNTTPPPIWKISTTRSPMETHHHHHHHHSTKTTPLHSSGSGLHSKEKKELSVSARKLAATLWEFNDLTPSSLKKEPMKSNKDNVERLCRSVLLAPQKLDPLFSPFSEKGKNELKDKKNCGKCEVGVKNRLKDAKSAISTSKKLLKLLSQMVVENNDSSRSMPLIFSMSNELDRARSQIDQFIQEQSSNQNDIENLLNHFVEEKIAWKRREKEKIREATTSIAQELEVEKKLRRQTERLNMKIAKEMENVKASYSKLSKEHEREKRAKEILEQVCDELAKGIGEDREQIEEMKRESGKIREEVEKEREMLQIADVLREERVHMKLSEAKHHFEEKNAMLENIRNELENFIRNKVQEKGDDLDANQGLEKLKNLEFYLNKKFLEFQNVEENDLIIKDSIDNEDESVESDLQSIELSMDNENTSYKWSYACENIPHFEAKRVSIDKDIGRTSFSDWGSICFNKGTKKKDFVDIQESCDQLEIGKSLEFIFGDEIQKGKIENESLRCIDGEAGENALFLEGCDMKKECAERN
ncbi:unnamed protein product [Trifolium pratense]|uniref:Uncharacterized protein n=1 Tax=Trifolium pratense TaxID=57577 RepID=A0ACB0KU36_TRIPR|nr:unnamed protein product [Trifolium pratense]